MSEKEVKINILGREYSIVSDQEAHIKKLESYVNDMMKKLSGVAGDITYTKHLILTCMYLADEVFKEKESSRMLLESLCADIDELICRNDRVLQEKSGVASD